MGDNSGTTTTLPRFQTIYNAHEFPKWAEKIEGPSVTMPDMVLSIDEIIRRFTRGIPVEGNRFPIYDGEQDQFPDLTFTDKLQIEELKVTMQDELRLINERQQERIRKQKAEIEKTQRAQEDKIVSRLKEWYKGADQGEKVQRTSGEKGE